MGKAKISINPFGQFVKKEKDKEKSPLFKEYKIKDPFRMTPIIIQEIGP